MLLPQRASALLHFVLAKFGLRWPALALSRGVAMWEPFDEGRTIGETGSESGSIQFDDEHTEGARITLERDGHTPFAITCGIYGWMMHTRFLGNEDDAKEAYENMKQALDGIIRSIPLKSDPDRDSKMRVTMKMIEKFVEQYP